MKHLLSQTTLSLLLLLNPGDGKAQSPAITNNGILKDVLPHPAGTDRDWLTGAEAYLQSSAYYFNAVNKSCFAAANVKQRAAFYVRGNAFTATGCATNMQDKSSWSMKMQMRSISKGVKNQMLYADLFQSAHERSLRYKNRFYCVEYVNDEQGLRQNFIIKEKPAGNQPLCLSLSIEGNTTPTLSGNNILEFKGSQFCNTVMSYDGLVVWDANNVPLAAKMELKGNVLQIIVQDRQAKYPVTIDPLSHTPEWTASADAVLPGLLNNLQLQVNAMLGYSVEGIGDINGDGFDDVAIGAPGAADVIAGPSIVAGAGAVFIYYGSANGLSTIPNRILRASTPVANAYFGFSIASGNVTGNAKHDLVISAPGDSYSTSVSGIPAVANVTAGKVYVFAGEDLSAAGNPSPLLSLYLNGAAYFSNGIAGVILPNVNINALFGFSVAVSEDLDGSGHGDIIVGSPGYADAQLINVRSGAAFVYYPGNLLTNTPTRLTAPSAASLGIANLNGLLFGFSVDGLGDYNKDGKPDIIVGAPAGLGVAANFLGGTAYVYSGNGAGINTNFSSRLTAGGSLLSTAANLFGYKVKAVRDQNGNRNGNVLVGAPAGNVLSNVAGGLRLKTGSLHTFLAKTLPGANVSPDQSFSSPRSSNLLSILGGQNLQVNALFGASIDNMLDVNCDHIGDIIVGEPLSSGVGIISANVVGGAAYVFTGNADGTYNPAPTSTIQNQVSADFGVNAASLLGYSVAGGGYTRGVTKPVRALVGAPGQAMDFSTGIFNLGSTFGTLYQFAAVNNNLGKAYTFPQIGCLVLAVKVTDFKSTVRDCHVSLQWKIAEAGNLDHVEIEQSEAGINFKKVQQQQSNREGSYLTDVPQASKTAFYRLKLINADGSFSYSEIISATTNCGIVNDLSVYPNPVSNASQLIFTTTEEGAAKVFVTDIYGRDLLQENIYVNSGINRIHMNFDKLPNGAYYIHISGKSLKSQSMKITRAD